MTEDQRKVVYPDSGRHLWPLERMLASMWLTHCGVSAADLTPEEQLQLVRDVRTEMYRAGCGGGSCV